MPTYAANDYFQSWSSYLPFSSSIFLFPWLILAVPLSSHLFRLDSPKLYRFDDDDELGL